MSTPRQTLPLGITPEQIDAVLEVVRWLKDPPALPPRDEGLWQQAVERAKRKAKGEHPGPPCWQVPPTTKEDLRLWRKEVDERAKLIAERAYRELDPAYAEAERKWRDDINEHIKQFELLLTPLRAEIAKLAIDGLHPFLCEQMELKFIHCQDATTRDDDKALVLWRQRELHAPFQHEGAAIMYDLERIKETVAYRQKPKRGVARRETSRVLLTPTMLLAAIETHHKFGMDLENPDPARQKQLACQLGCSQQAFSRAFARAFGRGAWKRYETMGARAALKGFYARARGDKDAMVLEVKDPHPGPSHFLDADPDDT